MHDEEPFLRRDGLLRYVYENAPKLIVLEAPAGYGKSTVARQVAGEARTAAIVDALGADALEFHRRLFEGLDAAPGDAEPADRDGLSASSVPAWRARCVRLWTAADEPRHLIFENMESAADDPEIMATLNDLFSRPHAQRRVIVCTRRPLPLRIGRFAYPHEVLRLGIADLRFSAAELAYLFALPADDPQVTSLLEVTRGWPIAALLLRRLRRRHPSLAALQGQESTQLFRVLADEVLSLLSDQAWEALYTICALPDATVGDVHAALGSAGDDAVRTLLSEAPFVDSYGDALQPHPLLRALVRERDPEAVRRAGERAAHGHLARDARLRAGKIFLELDDRAAALDAIRGLEATAWVGTPSYELGTILAALDRDTLVTDPGVWAYATTYGRALTISGQEWLHEGLDVWNRHQRTMSDDVALGVMANIINACMNIGMLDECERWLETMRERAPESLVYRLWSSAIAAMRARPLDVEALERDVVGPLGPGYPKAIYIYDVIARIHRLRGEREAERAASARALDIALATRLPIGIALTSTDAAFGAWLAGEEALYRDYVAIARQNYEAYPDARQGHFIDCIDGKGISAREGRGKLKTQAYAYLIAAAQAGAERTELLRRAFRSADTSAQPYARIIVRVARAAAEPARAASHLAEATAIAADVDSPRLREALADLQRGVDHPMLAVLVRRFRTTVSDLTFDIVGGRLTVSDEPIALGERQVELLTLLAVRRRAVHRDEIAAAMWPDAEPETAQGALRTLVSRLRSIPGLRDVIVTAGDGYALAATVVTPQRLRRSLEAFEANPAADGSEHTEIVNAFDALLLRDRSRVTRWEWFAETERELELVQERAGHALMTEALPRDPRAALTIARTMIGQDELDVTARSVAVQALLALGNVAAAHREVNEFETLCRETGAAGTEFPLRALLQSWQDGESSAS